MEERIAQLESRYQQLVEEFRAGAIDEATFVTEVDSLQFQDDYGRYWMLGSQSGAWHYYDGQSWHQADPYYRDQLPFMDDQGRYWQKGIKSGEWYFYQPDTGEWVKPGQEEPNQPSSMGQWQTPDAYSSPQTPAYAHQQPAADSQPSNQLDAQLYQDDEGRYWTMGAKSGQWYFYDETGWHPAHEFQAGGAPQQAQNNYPPQAAYYPPVQQPYQPDYQQPPAAQPMPGYGARGQTPPPQPVAPQPQQPDPASGAPTPPQGASQSGTWYYFDGNQWLQYSTGEPAAETPPDPTLILEHEPGRSKAKASREPMMAEFIEEDEPPVEVVDVEVITVFEAEPERQPEPEPEPVKQTPVAEQTKPVTPNIDEYIPRRTKPASSSEPAKPEPEPGPEPSFAPDPQPRRRTPSEPGQPIQPRKRAAHHEPTIIIPTGSTASSISSPSTTRARMPTKPVQPIDSRRARENTLPMEPLPLGGATGSRPTSPAPVESNRHRQNTQPLPTITGSALPRSKTDEARIARARQETQDKIPAAAPAAATTVNQPAQATAEPESSGYTFGDVLRSLPSTAWVAASGIAVMFVCAIIFIGGMSWFSDTPAEVSGASAAINATPTLDPGIAPLTTPTPGPTPTESQPNELPTPAAVTTFSSPNLDITLEYPENWQTSETDTQVIFSPSSDGLDPTQFNDTGMRIGILEGDTPSIADLLTELLALFPADVETLSEGTISIASQTWTSTLIRFDDENLGGPSYATIAVTNRDSTGYGLIAVAPADEWNTVQPVFQEMINSFQFGAEDVVAAQADTGGESNSGDEESPDEETTPTPTLEPTPAADAELDPVIHIVQSGDTLLGIAGQYGVDVDLLASENGITDPASLSIGQELTIPFTAEQLRNFRENSGTSAAAAASAEEESATEATTTEESSAAGGDEAAAPAPQTEATEEAPAEQSPATPLSGKIVYPAYNPGTTTYDLWIFDVAAGEQSGFAGNASQPAFNRDGSLLAYRSWDLGTRGIFFKDFVGGRGGIVTRFVEDGMPSWAPDSFTFAFSSRKEGDRVPRIYIGNQLGEDPIGLSFQGEYPSTLPDGRLVVKGCTPSGNCGIFVMGPRGGGEKKIAEGSDTAPAPSPDGSKIAFMSMREANNWEIWVMNADGSNPQRLTENGNNDGLPAWSPDGQSIAYASDQGGVWAIWVMNADGSNQRKLINMQGSPDGIVLHAESDSKGWLEERISWAP